MRRIFARNVTAAQLSGQVGAAGEIVYNVDNRSHYIMDGITVGGNPIESATAGLLKANNLSDVSVVSTARTNLGLGSASVQASTAFDASGSAAAVPTAGRILARNVLTAASGNYTPDPNATYLLIRMVAGGGGGGGADTAAVSGSAGGGGSSGGYAEAYFFVDTNSGPFAYTCGTGGTAGAAAGGTGGTAGNSTFVASSTVTAYGGIGGVGMASGITLLSSLGGGPTNLSTNGDVNSSGMSGGTGLRLTGLLAASGVGGSNIFGAGGPARNSQNTGSGGNGYGCGGSGGCCLNGGAAAAGGPGQGGCIVVIDIA